MANEKTPYFRPGEKNKCENSKYGITCNAGKTEYKRIINNTFVLKFGNKIELDRCYIMRNAQYDLIILLFVSVTEDADRAASKVS